MKKVIACTVAAIVFLTLCTSCKSLLYIYSGSGYIAIGEDVSLGNGLIDPTGIKKLVVDWPYGDVRIIGTDSDYIEIREENVPEGNSDHRLRYRVRNDTLNVKYAKTWSAFAEIDKDLFIYLPSDIDLSKITINQVEGSITVSNLSTTVFELYTTTSTVSISSVVCSSCRMEASSGSVYFQYCTFGKYVADTVASGITVLSSTFGSFVSNTTSGAVLITNSAVSKFECNTVGADITLDSTVMPDDIDIETVSGAVLLTIADGKGFGLAYSSVSGDLKCDDFNTVLSLGRFVYGDGSASYDITTVSGRIIIKKR